MQLSYYYTQAVSYADYHEYSPGPRNLGYLALGLAGEAGEFTDKVKKVLRDHDKKLSEDNIPDLVKELGDVLWYHACICYELEYPFYMLTARPIFNNRPLYFHSFKAYEDAVSEDISPSSGSLVHEALRLFKDVSKVGSAYSSLSDRPPGEMRLRAQNKLIWNLRKSFYQLAVCCRILKVPMEEMARLNLEKIEDRAKRGTLGGKGDDR
jgi:NTP pyrophosphatase (non-canonical NTP hydrolase)